MVPALERQIDAGLFCQLPPKWTARNADQRTRTASLGQLHVQLTSDTQTDDDNGFARCRSGETLSMNASGGHLDQRGRVVSNRVRQLENVASGCSDVVPKASVRIATLDCSVRAQIRLTDTTMKALPARNHRIDDHPIARLEVVVPVAIDDLSYNLMAHDERIMNRDSSAINLGVGSADTGVGHANQYPIVAKIGNTHLAKPH